MIASSSYPSRVLAGLMTEPEFFSFLATYAVPEDRANPIAVMREKWAASAAAFKTLPPYEPRGLVPWEPVWGDPSALNERPGMRSLLRHHPDAAFAAAPLEALVVHHPSLDLDQADYWAARLGDHAALAAPERNEADVQYAVGEGAQTVEIRARYALLGAFFSADRDSGLPLPRIGVHWQPGINLIQVGRLGDRLVLVNGHHRAYALARAGARHIPCLMYTISDLEIIGVSAGSGTETMLRDAAPPRLLHYLDPVLSLLVQLRRSTRVVRFGVSETTVQER